MQINFLKHNSIQQILLVIFLIALTVLGLFAWFTWRVHTIEKERVINLFESESIRIETAFTDTIDHTAFIMQMIISQIKPNYSDKGYINSILSKYRTTQNASNILSWTIFSWANAKHFITVDAVYGVMEKPFDLSIRDYIPMTEKEPGIIHLGKPVFGSTSSRWMIPAGIGAVDLKGNYIGAMTIGFDIVSMVDILKNNIKTDVIEFALIDKDLNVVMRSSQKFQEIGQSGTEIPDGTLKQSLKESFQSPPNQVFSQVNLLQDGHNYYFYKLKNYPYVLYTKYDERIVSNELWHDLTSRFVEITVIGIVALWLIMFIRENILRKAAEESHKEALRASKAKSDFLSYTNHELRSPLNAIILGSEMISGRFFGALSDKYADYAREIHNNGKDLLQFIEDLLDEAQASSGSFSVIEQETDLRDVIKRAVNLNSNRATKHRIAIETDIPDDLPNLWVDPKRMRQIINNLISNSIKYSPENTTISISAEMQEDKLLLTVKDQGFGMTEKELGIALTEYGTVKNQKTGLVDSIGLGLPLVKKLVEAHGAEFTIESEHNKGTKITITFPSERVYTRKQDKFISRASA